MRICFDATPLTVRRMTGAGRYVLTYLRALRDYGGRPEVVVVFSDPEARALIGDHPFGTRVLPRRPWLGPLQREAALQCGLRAVCREECVDVLHTTLDPVLPVRGVKQLLTLHDVARGGAAGGNGLRDRLRTTIRYGLAKKVDGVIAVTDHAAGEISRNLGVDRLRIAVVHTGLDPQWPRASEEAVTRVLASRGLTPGYILFVGQLGRQKNEGALARAWKKLRETGVEADLVLVGGGEASAELGDARVLRDVDDRELAALYRGAGAFCLPSFAEGFGLPVLEAMSVGLPVVVSKGTALQEVAGEAAIAVDPADPDSIMQGLMTALDSEKKEAWRAKSRNRAGDFSADSMVSQTLRAYREVLER